MYITFLRSSLINTARLCSGRCFIEYNIGRRSSDSDAAVKGTLIHGVLESLAKEKLLRQNGNPHQDIDPYQILKDAYEEYDNEKQGILKEGSYKECIGLLDKALTFQNGLYNPLNQQIVAIEHYFDFEVDRDWATYSYPTPDGELTGKLRIKGNSDLICKEDDNTLFIVDYKTGKSVKDWATDKEKTPENIKEDAQLKFYFYALAHEYPQYDNFMMTLYFLRLNKPLTALFDRSDLPEIEEWIRKGYKKLQKMEQPKFIDGTPMGWKCKMCQFSKTKEPGSNKSTCRFFQEKLKKEGFDRTMANYADFSLINAYGSGGGKEFIT